jgi:hypothetical protein
MAFEYQVALLAIDLHFVEGGSEALKDRFLL